MSTGIEREYTTRIYSGDKEPLVGSQIKSVKKSLIHYEAYFLPDFAPSVRVELGEEFSENEKKWKQLDSTWNSDFYMLQNGQMKNGRMKKMEIFHQKVTELMFFVILQQEILRFTLKLTSLIFL